MGFLAASRADVRRAETIFGALQRLRAGRAFAYLGLALAHANAGDLEQAITVLEGATALVSDAGERAEIDAFRGLFYHLGGRTSESQRALNMARRTRLAQAMLGLTEAEAQETAPV